MVRADFRFDRARRLLAVRLPAGTGGSWTRALSSSPEAVSRRPGRVAERAERAGCSQAHARGADDGYTVWPREQVDRPGDDASTGDIAARTAVSVMAGGVDRRSVRWVVADRLSVVLAAMAEVDGGAPSVIDRVCVAAVSLLSVSGAGLSLIVGGELRGSAGVSGPGIAKVQELQLSLGQGPCVDAWAAAESVTESDLAEPVVVRWPAFAQAAVESGVRAVFAFPLQLGAIRIGVLALYRDRPGELTAGEFGDGLVLADVAVQVILGLQAGAPPDGLHELLAGQPAYWAEVHQATGMTAAQLGVSLDDAFVRLRAHSFAENRQLRDVANDVVARRLRLEES